MLPTRRFAPVTLAPLIAVAACGAQEGPPRIEVQAVAGEPLDLDLAAAFGGEVIAGETLPAGAVLDGGVLAWTPDKDQIGEQLLRFGRVRGGTSPESVEVAMGVVEAVGGGPPVRYGGCECNRKPPRSGPSGDLAGGLLLAAATLVRRRAHAPRSP